MKPTVGRIVHYYGDGNKATACAAIIIHVRTPPDASVTLQVFNRLSDGCVRVGDVPYKPEPDGKGRCWTWPPREE